MTSSSKLKSLVFSSLKLSLRIERSVPHSMCSWIKSTSVSKIDRGTPYAHEFFNNSLKSNFLLKHDFKKPLNTSGVSMSCGFVFFF